MFEFTKPEPWTKSELFYQPRPAHDSPRWANGALLLPVAKHIRAILHGGFFTLEQ